ncbi:MAG: hypothetical protein U0V72_01555 [Cytophagales bacterium]
MKTNFKFLVLFLFAGSIFFYSSCINCNCKDIANKVIIAKGTFEDTDIQTSIFKVKSYSYAAQTDTISQSDFSIHLTTMETRIAQKEMENNYAGYGLYACSCVGPNLLDSTIRNYDTIENLEIRTLFDIYPSYKKGDLLNDSIYSFNPYNSNSDSSITLLNSKKVFSRTHFLKLTHKLSKKSPIQLAINATTKSGKVFQDTTMLMYIKP